MSFIFIKLLQEKSINFNEYSLGTILQVACLNLSLYNISVQVNATESLLEAALHSEKWGKLVFVFLEIIFWGLVSGFLHVKGMYIKL